MTQPPVSPITPPRSPAARHAAARRKRRLTWTVLVASLLVLALAAWAIWVFVGSSPETESAPPPAPEQSETDSPQPEDEPDAEEEQADEETIRILAMGDMLPHDSVNANAQTDDGWDYGQFFTDIQPMLETGDAIFCNQEVPSAGEEFGISGYPVFNAPQEFAEDLRQSVGCDLVNLANNHSADLGPQGIEVTRSVWDGLDPLSISGANRSAQEQNTIVYGEVGGVRTALVSFAEYSNARIDGVSVNFMADTDLVNRLLGEARAEADLVLVSAHWGTEDSHEVNGTQRAFAQQVADLGADVVLGTGPHVLQPVEWLDRADGGRTLVWYSLGNMLSTQLALPQLTGVIASFEVVPGADGAPATVENPEAVLTYMHYDWTPQEQAAGDLLARHNLSITPLAQSDELLARTQFGVSASDQFAASAEILGPEVTVH